MSDARSKVYLLDVEGTVAPLSLTSEVLFPYARAHFEEFLKRNLPSDAEVQKDISLLVQENTLEREAGAPNMITTGDDVPGEGHSGNGYSFTMTTIEYREAALKYIHWLIDRDRKSTALKSLQGKIWKAGFESGELKGTLFDDVPGALRRWSANARVAIYSSGSVEAQKLLFRHSTFGDLMPLITDYFDTRTGPKMEAASYAAITAAMHVAPQELLFFSDSVRELDAARAAGCGTRLVVRPGNPPAENAFGHIVVESFAGL